MIMQRICPDKMRLRELLEGGLPVEEQGRLSAHLDNCPDCQRRLEELAAGREAWSETARHLGQARSRLQGDLRRVVEELQAGDATEGKIGEGTAVEDLTLGFLDPPAKPGQLGCLGTYEVLEVLGRGGMGVVLKAFDPQLHRFVAIKVLAPQLATSAAARKRFAREAQAAAAISHDHVVAIHAVDETKGLPYLVMQCIAGVSLQERLDRSGPLELKEILRIGMQTAAGLAAAHAQGLIHRDIKPGNILLENGLERVKITDFGLARAMDDASLTQSGVVAGTPQYMAPEQARGEALDARADLFSLGSVLYALCTGRAPFRASTNLAILRRVSDETPRPVRAINPDIPRPLADIIGRLHAKDPAERFQSAAEVSELLGQYLAHLQEPSSERMPRIPPPTQVYTAPLCKHRRWAVAAALVLLLLGALGVTEATGRTQLVQLFATMFRIPTPEGTLVIEADDPAIKVTVEHGKEIVITGAGVGEFRLRPGDYRVRATRDGKVIKEELVTIIPDGRKPVRIYRESPVASQAGLPPVAPPAQPRTQPRPAPYVGTRPVEVLFENVVPRPHLPIRSVAIAPDGQLVASGCGGMLHDLGQLAVFDVKMGRAPVVRAEPEPVRSITFSPDGQLLATGEFDKTAKLRDAATGLTRIILRGHDAAVNAVAFSPDGKQLATGSWDMTIRIWDTATGREIRQIKDTQEIYALAYSPDGRGVFAGGSKHTASLWELAAGALRFTVQGHAKGIEAVAISPDGKVLATASWDRTIKLWDAATGKQLASLEGHSDAVLAIAFSPDAKVLASGSGRWGYDTPPGPSIGEIKLWDVVSCKQLAALPDQPERVMCVAFSPDGKTLAAGCWDGSLRLWDVATGKEKSRWHAARSVPPPPWPGPVLFVDPTPGTAPLGAPPSGAPSPGVKPEQPPPETR